MVVGEAFYQLGLIEQLHASVHQRLLYLLELLEEPVGQRLVALCRLATLFLRPELQRTRPILSYPVGR